MKENTSVLFVCTGNICRSPTAEGVFRSILESRKMNNYISTDSAGTHAYHVGNPPDSRSQATALKHGVDLSSLVARQVTDEDFDDFDYIIAMDHPNLANLEQNYSHKINNSKAKVHLFLEFAEDWSITQVPDPYFGGEDGFEEVFSMITDASNGLIKHIEMNKS